MIAASSLEALMDSLVPDWVSFDADKTVGLDLLGLRAPVQRIGNELFDGITTVTPKIRYLSVLTWIAHRYVRTRLPNEWSHFVKFAQIQEAVIVLSNRMQSRTTRNLVGVEKADVLLGAEGQSVPLSRLARNIAYNIYVTTSRQLHLTHEQGSVIGGLTEERGLKLAEAFEAQIADSAYDRALNKNPHVDSIKRSHLEEIADAVSIDAVPAAEQKILIDAILPRQPFDLRERKRLGHYGLMLWLTRHLGRELAEDDVFAAAIHLPSGLPQGLQDVTHDWLEYLIRDVLAVTHECVLEAVLRQIDLSADARGAPPLASDIVAALLDQTEEHEAVLRDLGLLEPEEMLTQLDFRAFRQRVHAICGDRPTTARGLRRWRNGLSEVDLYQRALRAGPAAPVFLPIAWCLVAERISLDAETDGENNRILALGSIFQIGLEDVILPKLNEFARADRSVREVMAELITRTVQQHLRVAWTRFMPANGKDVSVIMADGDSWARNGTFTAGRTDSRLRVAIDWLRQLRLTQERGLTETGERILARSLSVIDRAAS
jgi:hypothetical protein